MEGGGAPTTWANILTDFGFAISPGAAGPVRSGRGGLGTDSRKIGKRQWRLWCRRSAGKLAQAQVDFGEIRRTRPVSSDRGIMRDTRAPWIVSGLVKW